MQLYQKLIETPFGRLKALANDHALKAILWDGTELGAEPLTVVAREDHPILVEAERQMTAYFSGRIQKFDLPIEPVGTPFQIKVWKRLMEIPYGETKSYAQIAKMIDQPNAVRAIGGANKRNPLAIIVPCHRVIGSNGNLTGFAGSISTKKVLLSLEAKVCGRAEALPLA